MYFFVPGCANASAEAVFCSVVDKSQIESISLVTQYPFGSETERDFWLWLPVRWAEATVRCYNNWKVITISSKCITSGRIEVGLWLANRGRLWRICMLYWSLISFGWRKINLGEFARYWHNVWVEIFSNIDPCHERFLLCWGSYQFRTCSNRCKEGVLLRDWSWNWLWSFSGTIIWSLYNLGSIFIQLCTDDGHMVKFCSLLCQTKKLLVIVVQFVLLKFANVEGFELLWIPWFKRY